ncbi:MAG: hypothetical protein NZL99_01580 [Burkholderiaceae bacterium]|nr:hypothetical protein [Burkholderiaceae bacterium]
MTPVAQIALPPSHPVFAGHFPGYPIAPGALLLGWVQQQADDWLQAQGDARRVAAVASVKFLRPLRPGEAATLALEAADHDRLRFAIDVAGSRCASGTLLLQQDAPR